MRSKASSPFRTVRTLLDSEDSPQKKLRSPQYFNRFWPYSKMPFNSL